MSICNRDCLHCIYTDCICDEMTAEDWRQAREIDEYAAPRTVKKKARSARQREYYAANEAAIRAQRREYYQAHREAICAYQRAYREANKMACAAYRREYYQTHKATILAQKREKYKEAKKYVNVQAG